LKIILIRALLARQRLVRNKYSLYQKKYFALALAIVY